ncbi:MAG: hypothetical protein HYU28_06365 [Actinobacteria bacterium]|nr:hypothetical protein [Actinomycetota bacterium]
MRASGIPARYARGFVLFTQEELMSWMRVETEAALDRVLSSSWNEWGKQEVGADQAHASAYGRDHTWVVAFVPVDPAGAVTTWIPLDPSFKRHRRESGIDVEVAMGLDTTNYLAARRQGATIGPNADYIANVNPTAHTAELVEHDQALTAYIGANLPEGDLRDLVGGWRIDPVDVRDLTHAVQFEEWSVEGSVSELAASDRAMVRFDLPGLSVTQSLPEVMGHRVTVVYRGATAADEQAIVNQGGVVGLNPSSVSVVPVLSLDGRELGRGHATTLGRLQTLRVTSSVVRSSYAWDKVLVAGGAYGLASRAQGSGAGLVEGRAQALRARIEAAKVPTVTYADDYDTVVERVVSPAAARSDDILGEALHLTAMQWLVETELTRLAVGGMHGVVEHYWYKFMLSREEPLVYVDDSDNPVRLEFDPLTIDGGGWIASTHSARGNEGEERDYDLAADP